MSALPAPFAQLEAALDDRTRSILESRHGSVRRRGWLMRRALLASDLLGLTLAFCLTELVFIGQSRPGRFGLAGEALLFAASLPFWIFVAKLYGLYERDEERTDHSTVDDFFGVVHLATVAAWLLFAFAFFTHVADPELPKLLLFWALTITGVPLIRAAARVRCRRSLYYVQNTLIVGAGRVAEQVASKVLRHPEYGLNLVGFCDDNPESENFGLGPLNVLGGTDDVLEIVRLLDVERVIVGFSERSDADLLDIVRELNRMGVQVDVVPRFYEVTSSAVDVHSVEGMPLVGLRPPSLSRSSALLKRSLDLTLGLTSVALLSPFLALIAIAIKLDSRGPVLFIQSRKGQRDRSFAIFKFRTMHAGADDRRNELAQLNKHAADPRMFKIDRDPRVTRVGRFLRRFSLDELPQLWNVVRGEMSLVGPRPLVLDEHAHVSDWAERRLDLRPGITGLWQVLGRDDLAFAEMVKLDYVYVTSWSLGGDLRLLARTVPVVLRGSSR